MAGMTTLATLKAGLELVPGLMNYGFNRDAAKQTLDIGRKNIELSKIQTREELRRLGRTQEEAVSTTKAALASSGFKSGVGDVSGQNYITDMEQQFAAQRDWIKMVGAKKEEIIGAEASLRAKSLGQQGLASAVGSVASSFATVGRELNWWNT